MGVPRYDHSQMEKDKYHMMADMQNLKKDTSELIYKTEIDSPTEKINFMYGCENWTIKKAECRRIDAFELW